MMLESATSKLELKMVDWQNFIRRRSIIL